MPLRTAIRVEPHRRDEDRAIVLSDHHGLLVIVADGAGGIPGGARAADVVVTLASALPRPDDEAALVRRALDIDDACTNDAAAGESTLVLVRVFSDGRVLGASCGDSEAWLVSADAPITKLTAGQHKKRRVGSGRAVPVAFSGALGAGATLVVGSDGLFGYVDPAALVRALGKPDVDGCAAALLRLAQDPPVALADDFACVVVRHLASAAV